MTPIEAIQREITDRINYSSDVMRASRSWRINLAALGLALADAEREAILDSETWGHTKQCVCAYCCNVHDARTALYALLTEGE